MNIGKWFNNLSFLAKMILVYTVFAILPMVAVTGYNYGQTRKILENQSYQEMRQTMETTEKSLEAIFQSCESIMDMLYTNQMLNSYLSMDYTQLSYWEMFSFVDTQLRGISVLNPDINRISFYSSNDTLPRDNYYFYPMQELPAGFEEKASLAGGGTVAGGIMKKEGNSYVGLLRKMNYFSSGGVDNILLMQVDADYLNSQLSSTDDYRQLYLVDGTGQILASSNPEAAGTSMESLLPSWNTLGSGGVPENAVMMEKNVVCMRKEANMGTSLFLLRDQESLRQEAGRVSRRILLIFVVSSVFVFAAVFTYGKLMQKRVDQVVYAARKLGDGEFDYRLKNMGSDEIGQIADAFNLLNERIQVLIRDNYEKKLLIKSSEMNLLQEQINPHFLYNALSVISSMAMREGGKRTVESVRYLAAFYRISLNKGRQIVSVQEELELVKSYMNIQAIRFGDSVEVSYDVDREALACRTIKLILQPLVENAIHHGRRDEGVLHIRVTVGKKKDRVFYEVKDDGLGMEPDRLVILREQLRQSQEGFGLRNVDIRVKLHYGEPYGVAAVNSEPGKGTEIRVEIPDCTNNT